MRSHKTVAAFSFGALAVLFLLSLLVREPYLERPLSGQSSEWSTAHALCFLKIWQQEGALKNRFCLNTSFPSSSNKHIPNNINNSPSTAYKDKTGNYYYISCPPFTLIAPYLVFKLLGVEPDVLPIRVFGLIIHFLICIFVFLTVDRLTNKIPLSRLSNPAIAAAVTYLFFPGCLYYHGQVYVFEIFVQLPFIIGIYAFARFLATEKPRAADYWLLGGANFFMNYTEWIGVLFAVYILGYSAFHFREKKFRALFVWILATLSAAILLTLWQYSQVNSLSSLLTALTNRSQERTLCLVNLGNLGSYLATISQHFWTMFGYFLCGTILLAVIALMVRKKLPRIEQAFNPSKVLLWGTFGISAVPALLYITILLPYCAQHPFSVLKLAFFFSLAIASLCGFIEKRAGKTFLLGLLGCVLVGLSVIQYKNDHRDFDPTDMIIGQYIRDHAASDEMVFLQTGSLLQSRSVLTPIVIYYAGRNISLIKYQEDVIDYININHVIKAVIFYVDTDTFPPKISVAERIDLTQTLLRRLLSQRA